MAAAPDIARRLVRDAPPGQLREVLAGVRALVSFDERAAVEAALPAVVAEVHARDYALVTLPSGDAVLLTPDGLRPGEPPSFYDPATKQLLDIDFGAAPRASAPGVAVCTGVSPLPPADVARLERAEPLRAAVERLLGAYVRQNYPSAHLTVYALGGGDEGAEGDEQVVVACYGAKSVALASMYAGALTARWELRATAGAASARGHARACLHTFEEGNVRLDVERSWRAQLDEVDGVDALAGALVTLVRRSEGEWHEELLDGFADLGGHAIKALRRPLPMTRTKFDWERATVHGLADELAQAKI